jgi:hypothetical protein
MSTEFNTVSVKPKNLLKLLKEINDIGLPVSINAFSEQTILLILTILTNGIDSINLSELTLSTAVDVDCEAVVDLAVGAGDEVVTAAWFLLWSLRQSVLEWPFDLQ